MLCRSSRMYPKYTSLLASRLRRNPPRSRPRNLRRASLGRIAVTMRGGSVSIFRPGTLLFKQFCCRPRIESAAELETLRRWPGVDVMPDMDSLIGNGSEDEPHLPPLSNEGEFPCFSEVRVERRPNNSGQG